MNRRTFFTIFFALFCGSLIFSYQWPVEPRVLAVFAQWNEDGFHRGVQLSSTGGEVRPIEDGELIFYFDERSPAALPYPIGSFVVLQHQNAIRTMYANLDIAESRISEGKTFFTKQDPVGNVGDSGALELNSLSLYIYDVELRQFVNPFLLLPSVLDTFRPVIRNFQLINNERTISLPVGGAVPRGRWEVVGEVFDLSTAIPTFWPMGIYKVSLSVNGQEQFSVTMDTLKEHEGMVGVFPSKGLTFQQMYRNKHTKSFGLITLNPGSVHIEIVAEDFARNERTQIYRFIVE